MVTLEQIRQLDAKVHRAVDVIAKLREENTTLKDRLSEYQGRIEELEVLISNFKEDQSEIEHGITSALSQLAAIDDSGKPAPAPAAEHKVHQPQKPAPPDHTDQQAQKPAPAGPTPQPEEEAATEELVDQPQEAEEDDEDQDAELDIF